MRHCSIEDVRPDLRRELEHLQAFSQERGIAVAVEIEELCLLNVPQAAAGLEWLYDVPEGQKHRIVPSPTGTSQHYQWLCFSTPSVAPPPAEIGLPGDVWVITSSKAQKIYHRVDRLGWKLVPPRVWIPHPFAPELHLAFGISKLGWFPMELMTDVFPAVWKYQGAPNEYARVPPSAAVKALYETTGRPIDHGDLASLATVSHSCGDSRASKQWDADRVRFYFNFRDRPVDDRASQPHTGSLPLAAGGHPSTMLVPRASGHDYLNDAPPECLPVAQGISILRINGVFRKVNLQRIRTYAKNFESALTAPKVLAGPTGPMLLCDTDRDLRPATLHCFISLVENDIECKKYDYSTSELVSVLRICASDKLGAPVVKKSVKRRLRRMWVFSFERVSRGRLADAPEALVAARWYGLTKIKKRALFEFMRSPDALCDILKSDYPQEWYLGKSGVPRLWEVREVLEATWSTFIMEPPQALCRPCPTYGGQSPCSAARRQLVDEWADTVGQPMVEGEHQFDPIGGMQELARMDWRSYGMCIGCVRAMLQLCEGKKVEWYERFDAWIQPELWCVDEGEVGPDDYDNMPYIDSDDEGEGSEDDGDDDDGEMDTTEF
ncbi:hypothetical protein K466DRAFT_599617 [Polyporus arcularius HHB13444]|uniref:Uncharacterized protein n=1 Tax=Polyporus arcularius HHB13444 TaxID=1314778 RepID=A0A5C3PBY4_9APHY|nr:hypothetical protein K466DRAFT_599617 [Polyporus arcularius HHB13444]